MSLVEKVLPAVLLQYKFPEVLNGGAGSANAGGNGSMSITYSISCQPGYYAYCNLSGSECKND